MSTTILAAVLAVIVLGAGSVIALIMHGGAHSQNSKDPKHKKKGKSSGKDIENLTQDAKDDVERIFNDDFREELRNRGRLHFEKIISENAMFLQQDLRLTTSELNEFMKNEITTTLKDEFKKYEESINDAKQLAIDSIEKTQTTIEQQRQVLTKQLSDQLAADKKRSLDRFESHMADIVNHYILEAVGEQIDMNDQLEFIIAQLERNKDAIIEDVKEGA